ncbi:TPA: sulfate/thiosulfate ABC transporter ATP-binding protein CysA [Proteus mirabilis]|uniref:sulfate/thiosulfate ABC transporter ATP-binding protein CysA n=1 Tax=Proteus mirabilis TaxID=584 RepID=UPI0013D5B983|nr:sulfate/thiosulfate ABC transporter ATP-binding protein CysA [Proteus mirabilis]MBG2848992.1 sulfate/thiosulfate ABC transporter ATP-binding protein CysA [Proteus mirabilis]MBG3124023.1 sulfate/thiosulfate ABC transporter ATP-binding protein CysA [Proteus mirabilis]MBI6292517.1 sulfate/thiosulfate ABC transporter ATP-binding protein CysA [Proteus mirabilis]MBI6323490.1 sulfate/thiosulfate ABC transporter ATP-binding protein CysA [Proteus mirabilis]MBI6399374.1 sulfate/thiosulfate ABC transp
MSIEINHVTKYFDRTEVLHDVNLTVNSGEMMALLGPSGSGKTTLLRIIAGLEHQTEGKICFAGQDVSRLHARERKVGFVFQHYALFRHMTVFENIAFGLTVLPRRERPNKAAIDKKVTQLLEMIQLPHLAQRYPAQLSGGQKQRVALARALAVEPQILLLDEPFGALDAKVRTELRSWLRELHSELKFTSVFVTHDQQEAMEVADRIVIMGNGKIEQVGTPQQVWHTPESRFVLEFLGDVNHLQGEINGAQLQIAGYHLPLSVTPLYQGKVDVFLRPWEISLNPHSDSLCKLPVKVIEVTPKGHYWQLVLQPIEWGNTPISAVWNDMTSIPHKGDIYYMGGAKARLYAEDRPLTTVSLAYTA